MKNYDVNNSVRSIVYSLTMLWAIFPLSVILPFLIKPKYFKTFVLAFSYFLRTIEEAYFMRFSILFKSSFIYILCLYYKKIGSMYFNCYIYLLTLAIYLFKLILSGLLDSIFIVGIYLIVKFCIVFIIMVFEDYVLRLLGILEIFKVQT